MKLKNAILRPGRVLEVMENGCIKADVPGLFSKQDVDVLPPIMPFFGPQSKGYSSPYINREVWVLNETDNNMQLFWFPKNEESIDSSHAIEGENVEIVCNRENGADWASLYFSDGTGWIMSGSGGTVQIKTDGSICLKTPNLYRTIDINAESISLGSEGKSSHPAVHGDILLDILYKISSTFKALRIMAGTNVMTAPLIKALDKSPEEMDLLMQKLNSGHVTLE